MIDISPETVEKFKQIFKDKYGVEYSDQKAREATANLVAVFDWLLKEDQKQHPENYKNSEKQGRVNNLI